MSTDNTGTANSPYNAVTIETISGEIQAGPHNTNYGNLDTAIESHTHPLDGLVGLDSMKSSYRPPDTGDSTNHWRLVSGTKTVTVSYGAGTAQITFATDADQGDPSFTTAPRTVITVLYAGGTFPDAMLVAGSGSVPSTTTAIANVYDAVGTYSGSAVVHWIAYGKVA